MSDSDRPTPPAAALRVTGLLERYGLRPKRTLGQNFLADAGLCEKIARTVSPGGGGSVLEIGAGTGALTAPLLALGCRVTAVETDRALCQVLRDTFADALASGQLSLLEADVQTLDLDAIFGAMPAPRTLAGNLPYHLSGLLLRRMVELATAPERSVFLLQLEVVDRMCAAPDSDAYGALSVFVQAVAAPARAFVVKRGAFYPQPNVDSAVVVATPLARPYTVDEVFSSLVRAAFEKRRKTLRNAWRNVLGVSSADLESHAAAAGVDLGRRGETLAVADFDRMASRLRGLGQERP